MEKPDIFIWGLHGPLEFAAICILVYALIGEVRPEASSILRGAQDLLAMAPQVPGIGERSGFVDSLQSNRARTTVFLYCFYAAWVGAAFLLIRRRVAARSVVEGLAYSIPAHFILMLPYESVITVSDSLRGGTTALSGRLALFGDLGLIAVLFGLYVVPALSASTGVPGRRIAGGMLAVPPVTFLALAVLLVVGMMWLYLPDIVRPLREIGGLWPARIAVLAVSPLVAVRAAHSLSERCSGTFWSWASGLTLGLSGAFMAVTLARGFGIGLTVTIMFIVVPMLLAFTMERILAPITSRTVAMLITLAAYPILLALGIMAVTLVPHS